MYSDYDRSGKISSGSSSKHRDTGNNRNTREKYVRSDKNKSDQSKSSSSRSRTPEINVGSAENEKKSWERNADTFFDKRRKRNPTSIFDNQGHDKKRASTERKHMNIQKNASESSDQKALAANYALNDEFEKRGHVTKEEFFKICEEMGIPAKDVMENKHLRESARKFSIDIGPALCPTSAYTLANITSFTPANTSKTLNLSSMFTPQTIALLRNSGNPNPSSNALPGGSSKFSNLLTQ